MVAILLHLSAAACYLLAQRQTMFLPAAALLHAAALGGEYLHNPRLDIGISASALMLLAAIAGWRQTRLPLSRTLLLWLTAAAVFAPLTFAANKPPPPAAAFAHIIPAALAYAFAIVAVLQSMDLWRAEHLRRALKPDSAPPLLTLEEECFRTLNRAFWLLTLALASGMLLGGGAPAHKLLFAGLTWLTFGALLAGRKWRGWRGQAARWWLAAGLLFFVLSYFGTHFVLQVLLDRSS